VAGATGQIGNGIQLKNVGDVRWNIVMVTVRSRITSELHLISFYKKTGRVRYQYGANSNDPRSSNANTAVDQYRSATSTQLPEMPVENSTITSNYISDSQSETKPRPSFYGAHSSPAVLTASQVSAGHEATLPAHHRVDQEAGEELDLRRGRSNTDVELNAPDEVVLSNYPHPVQDFQGEAGGSRVSNPYSNTYPQSTTYEFDGQGSESYETQPAPTGGYGSRGQEPNPYFPRSSQNVGYASGDQSTGLYSPQSISGVSYSSRGQSFSQYPPIASYGPGGPMTTSYIPQSATKGNYTSGNRPLYQPPETTSSYSPYQAPSNVDATYDEQNSYADSHETEAFDDTNTFDSPSEDEDPTPPALFRSQRRSSNSIEGVAEAMVGLTTSETIGRRSECKNYRLQEILI
jgi:hypothetical protein